ncbi:MAG: hypothetical protein JW862_05295 [Anaerolineales bacterium]|nr:hypothetical protein [Anaerolineales bacterium]
MSDADLAWVRELGSRNPPVELLLISCEWDDILTPAAAASLYDKLKGETSQRQEADPN